MNDKPCLTCPDCGEKLLRLYACRVHEHLYGREHERVRECPNCKARYMTREVVTRKLPG